MTQSSWGLFPSIVKAKVLSLDNTASTVDRVCDKPWLGPWVGLITMSIVRLPKWI